MNRFERHPVATLFCVIITCLILLGLAAEIVVRIVNPPMLSFVYQFRQVLRFHPRWRVDYEPNTVSWFRLPGASGNHFFNFLVTINEHGFRTWDRELDNNVIAVSKGTRVIHATGDSFTMGWGCNFEASYPAILDSMLPPDTRVIDLGLPGFGTIAATEKSLSVWSKFPAAMCIYMFCPTIYGNDETADRVSKAGPLSHALAPIRDWLRTHTYLANWEYARECHKQFGKQFHLVPGDFATQKGFCPSDSKKIAPVEVKMEASDSSQGRLSKAALLKYRDFLKERNVPLTVIALEDAPICRDFYAFCRENGVEAYLIQPPQELLLRKEGHLNQMGNYRLAEFAKELIERKRSQ